VTRLAWSPTPPRFVRRWAVQGAKRDGNLATTIFDLLEYRRHVAVFPATVETFAVLIDRAAIHMLLATLRSGDSCAVPAWHAVHGNRLLGLRSFEEKVELYEVLPHAEINISYAGERLLALGNVLTDITRCMQAEAPFSP
jgi:hypothetical protein